MDKEIPKVIHYCWFGGNELTDLAKKCIASWQKYFPQYKIVRWDESNFDINCCEYIKEAYKLKKWAHVSDFVRIKVLFEQGGIYFDTDVEVIKSYDDILLNGQFIGCEREDGGINPGLGMGFFPKNKILKEILNTYLNDSFYDTKGNPDLYKTIVVRTSNVLIKHGYQAKNENQIVCDINIYKKEYFNPMDYETGKLYIVENTHSIHWFDASWFPKGDKHIHKMEQKIRNVMNKRLANICCFIYRKGYRLLELVKIIKK